MDYYNENDPNAAAWLMALIEDGLIPEGHVDVRSITDVSAAELVGYVQCHFFAGIGGWPLALQIAGWPRDRRIWTGSCPCQPFSAAGRQAGEKDERHLWPVFSKLIEAGKPPVVAGEQVASKLGRSWLAGVFADLEGMGYRRAGANLCSAGVGSPNIRQRLFWLGDSDMHECHGSERGKAEEAAGRRDDQECADRRRASESARTGISVGLGIANSSVAKFAERIGAMPNQEEGTRSRYKSYGSGDAGRLADSTAQRERSGESEGDIKSRLVMDGAESGGNSDDHGEVGVAHRMGDSNEQGLEGRGERGERAGELSAWQASPWSEYDIARCRDGKARRIPKGSLESNVQFLADGISSKVADLWHQGYPLAWQKIESRVPLLKGLGNAINPFVAAEFIRAYMEAELLTTRNNQLP